MIKIKELIKMVIDVNNNENTRNDFLKKTLSALPRRLRILDAGAGELRNRSLCSHLNYVSQDICEYDGLGNSQGLHTSQWDTRFVDIVCDIANIPEPSGSFDVILCSEVF